MEGPRGDGGDGDLVTDCAAITTAVNRKRVRG